MYFREEIRGTVDIITCSLFPVFFKPSKHGIKALGQSCLLSKLPGNGYSLSLENYAHIPELQKCKIEILRGQLTFVKWKGKSEGALVKLWLDLAAMEVAASVGFKNS